MKEFWFKFYAFYSWLLEKLFNWVPFSVGDLYILILIMVLAREIIILTKKTLIKPRKIFRSLLRIGIFFLLLYAQFMLSWGLNYQFRSFTKEQGLKPIESNGGIEKLFDYLLTHCEKERLKLCIYNGGPASADTSQMLFRQAEKDFSSSESRLDIKNPFPRVKSSFYSYGLNYINTGGYYNPFSGESQVNDQIPRSILPFTACHELAHQAGYGFEYEASLIGYLVCIRSKNTEFRYSGYFQSLLEAMQEMYHKDSVLYRKKMKAINPLVLKDIKTVFKYDRKYNGIASKISSLIYGQYLKANKQPQGLKSYSDFVPLLISWYNKEGYH